MPDTPIDLSEGIQSVRLKVPTAEVPIPPEGFAQLHSPAPGELALRLPDGSVVAVGGGGGGGGAATSVLGPGGAIDAANTDPRIGININAVPGTGIGFTGRFLDQFANPLGVQADPVVISSAELLALHTTSKVLVAAPAAGLVIAPLGFVFVRRGAGGSYVFDPTAKFLIGPPGDLGDASYSLSSLGLFTGDLLVYAPRVLPDGWIETGTYGGGEPLAIGVTHPMTVGTDPLTVVSVYLVV